MPVLTLREGPRVGATRVMAAWIDRDTVESLAFLAGVGAMLLVWVVCVIGSMTEKIRRDREQLERDRRDLLEELDE